MNTATTAGCIEVHVFVYQIAGFNARSKSAQQLKLHVKQQQKQQT